MATRPVATTPPLDARFKTTLLAPDRKYLSFQVEPVEVGGVKATRSALLPDAGVRRHEPRVDRERVAAQPGFASVPLLLHGVPCGRSHAGPPDQEGPEGAAEDGGQLPQVS